MTPPWDHVVVVHVLLWDKRKSQIKEYSDLTYYVLLLRIMALFGLSTAIKIHYQLSWAQYLIILLNKSLNIDNNDKDINSSCVGDVS